MRHHHETARQHASTAQALDGSSDDQDHRVGRERTEETPGLEDGERRQVGPFHVEKGVDAAVERLECGRSQQVGRAIPPDIIIGFELIRDEGDRLVPSQLPATHSESWEAILIPL